MLPPLERDDMVMMMMKMLSTKTTKWTTSTRTYDLEEVTKCVHTSIESQRSKREKRIFAVSAKLLSMQRLSPCEESEGVQNPDDGDVNGAC